MWSEAPGPGLKALWDVRRGERENGEKEAEDARMMKIVWNGAELSSGKDSVRLDGRELALSRMERKLLLYLARHPDTVLSRERLLREVWEYELPGATRTVDTHVKNLRARLGGLGDFIVTVRGVGYRLDTGAGRADGHRRVRRPAAASGRKTAS